MLKLPAPLQKPGLFVTGTDTGVGKTVVACAILAALRELAHSRGLRLGVCKPFATGCHEGRDGPVQEDVQALMHFADARGPACRVCPQWFRTPASPAAAAAQENRDIDWDAVATALIETDRAHDAVLVEGLGGVMVPLDPKHPRYTVRDMIDAIGYPVVVVCRAGLGTLNHTAMTVDVLQRGGCRVVGLVMNHVEGRDGLNGDSSADSSLTSNRLWLERMTGIKVLCEIPAARPAAMDPAKGRLDPAVLAAARAHHWGDLFAAPVPR